MANDVKNSIKIPFVKSLTDLVEGLEFQLVEGDRDPRRTANRLRSHLEAKKVAKLASVQAQLAKVDEEAARLDAEKARAKAELARIQAMIAAKDGTEIPEAGGVWITNGSGRFGGVWITGLLHKRLFPLVQIDHNIGLVKFFGDGCTDPKRLLDLLNDVKKRSEELARASAEPEESVCMEKLTSVATFNIAVIWFHLHEYAKALSVVEPLFQNSGSIDEEIALNSCLLLRDVLLACHDATKSADVLLYLENLLLHLKDGLPTVASILGPNALANAFSDIDPLRSGYLELKMLLYKVQFLLLTKNLKQAEHNLKHATSISTRKRDLSMVTFLKSQLAYASGKYPGAIIMLNYLRDINKEDTRIQSMINNNLGCVYYKWGKYHASSIFFSKALKFCSPLRKDRPLNCTTIPPDNSLLIVYNCGMQYLARGKPL